MRPTTSDPMTVDHLLAKVLEAKQEWGGEVPIGVVLSGSGLSDATFPMLDFVIHPTRMRVTAIVNFSDAARKKHEPDLA